jgi:Ca2+-binding RTX toxin-like protein
MQKSEIMGLVTIVAIFSILATVNANIYAQEINVGTDGDDKIKSGDGDDGNIGLSGDDKISSGDGDDFNVGDSNNPFPNGYIDNGDDVIKSGKGNDINLGDSQLNQPGGDDKINGGQGDDIMRGMDGADKFQCGSGNDQVFDFDESEGDKATGNCENVG